MKFINKLRIFSEFKLFLNSDSTIFLLDTLKKRKSYLLLNLCSGLADVCLEFITISMLYFIILILTSENKVIDWESIAFIKNFSFLIDYFSNISFKNIFIFSVIITLIVQILQVFVKYLNLLSTSFIEAGYISLITRNIYNFIFSLTYKYSSKYKMGDLADYISASPQTVRVYIFNLNQLFLNSSLIFAYLIFLVKVSVWNIITVLFIAIIYNKISSIVAPNIHFLSSKVLKNTVLLSESIIEKFQALRFIYSNGLHHFTINDLNQKTYQLEKSLKKVSFRIHILPSIVSLFPIILLAFVSIIYYFFSERNSLIATLGILLVSLQRINTRFIGLASSLSKLAEFRPKLNRIISLFKARDLKLRRLGGHNVKFPVKEIIFSRINFKYSPRAKFSLKDLNFTLKTGEVTALVGLSGSGKSSILDLLVGLFEPDSGDILIDGTLLKDIDLNKWQREISIVSQDSFLLNDSIINNIKFGLGRVSFKDIKKACIDSGAHQFIESLPNSYNTIIGERGLELSGGERQRLSIARAFLKKSSILILDEATSALDSKNEKFIKQNIDKVRNNKITLIVTHRLGTIKEADNILVLNKGRIIERGNHQFLIDQNNIYKKLWAIQSKI